MKDNIAKNSKRYLFVCGCPRSGTTALMHLLNGHSSVVVGIERYKKLAKPEHIDRLEKSFFERDFFLDIRHGQTNLNPNHKSWDSKWKKVYDAMRPKFERDDLIVGDKFPYYYKFYHELSGKFSNPKWIFIVRDIQEVAMSYNSRAANSKDRWSEEMDYTYAVLDWNDSLQKTIDYLDSGADNLFVCDYARLFSYSPDYFGAMLNFLDVTVDKDVSDHYQQLTEGWEERMNQKKILPPQQQEYIEANARWDLRDELLQRCGVKSPVEVL